MLDFNVIQPDGDHPRREVSDDYAASLYCANHAIERLRNDKVHDAFACTLASSAATSCSNSATLCSNKRTRASIRCISSPLKNPRHRSDVRVAQHFDGGRGPFPGLDWHDGERVVRPA